jgi:hypothetical protein
MPPGPGAASTRRRSRAGGSRGFPPRSHPAARPLQSASRSGAPPRGMAGDDSNRERGRARGAGTASARQRMRHRTVATREVGNSRLGASRVAYTSCLTGATPPERRRGWQGRPLVRAQARCKRQWLSYELDPEAVADQPRHLAGAAQRRRSRRRRAPLSRPAYPTSSATLAAIARCPSALGWIRSKLQNECSRVVSTRRRSALQAVRSGSVARTRVTSGRASGGDQPVELVSESSAVAAQVEPHVVAAG